MDRFLSAIYKNVITDNNKITKVSHNSDSSCERSFRNSFQFTNILGRCEIYVSYSVLRHSERCHIYVKIVDPQSGCWTGVSEYHTDTTIKWIDILTKKILAAITRMERKVVKSRQKHKEKAEKEQKKTSQKEAFEYMIRELGLQNKLTCSRTGKVVKVQVNSDIEKMKKIFGILAEISEEEVNQMYSLAQIQ